VTADFHARLLHYMSDQRWFAGKGGVSSIGEVVRLPWLTTTSHEPRVRVELVTVVTDGAPQVYQVPMAYYESEPERMAHAHVGVYDDPDHGRLIAYDALHDRAAIGALVRGFVEPDTGGGIRHTVLGRVELDTDTPSVMLTGEQSNTSLVLGEDLLLKMFRKVAPGLNPDIEVHAALTRAGSDTIARLRGWITTTPTDGRDGYELAMLQNYLRSGADGWEYARASVRDLMMEADLHADEVGGDFAAEAERLGATTARLHGDLADALETDTWTGVDVQRLADRLRARLADAVAAAPELASYQAALGAAYDDLARLDADLPVQRIHGDLHLGQSLRTIGGWVIIDFEGEPAKPLSERRALDSPIRDIAGMLRSFDYAAYSMVLPSDMSFQERHRVDEWSERNRAAFLDGYASVNGDDPRHHATLLRAYEIDKAAYEVVYERRNRPGWVNIPLSAIERLTDVVRAGRRGQPTE
jgi:maltokinase